MNNESRKRIAVDKIKKSFPGWFKPEKMDQKLRTQLAKIGHLRYKYRGKGGQVCKVVMRGISWFDNSAAKVPIGLKR